MKILYGVVGEGMGHAIRSRVVLEHLVGRGHQVEIMTSGRARDFLSSRFDDVNLIHGLHMISEENQVRYGKTLWSNLVKGLGGLPRNIAAYFELVDDFAPEVVISDFESWTYYYAKLHDLPIFSIDNMQIINRCRHEEDVLHGERVQFEMTRAFVKGKLPFCDYYLITSFFRPPIRKEDTALFPPILRSEILEAKAQPGGHLLAYQTATGFEKLQATLKSLGREVRVYGVKRGLETDEVDGNLVHRPFSEETFIGDLSTAVAVLGSAGFTLMGECVYLGVPMIAVPLDNQFEQLLNARYLEKYGYGISVERPAELGRIGDFLANVDRYREKLSEYTQDGNVELLSALDRLLAGKH